MLGFVVAKEYFDFWLFHPFCVLIGCIPVKRDGKDLAATRAALRTLGEGRVVPIFPEGQILATSGREIGEGKRGQLSSRSMPGHRLCLPTSAGHLRPTRWSLL